MGKAVRSASNADIFSGRRPINFEDFPNGIGVRRVCVVPRSNLCAYLGTVAIALKRALRTALGFSIYAPFAGANFTIAQSLCAYLRTVAIALKRALRTALGFSIYAPFAGANFTIAQSDAIADYNWSYTGAFGCSLNATFAVPICIH
jgi:RsiW-degrading membrane proteinase PrsW (M82 family)